MHRFKIVFFTLALAAPALADEASVSLVGAASSTVTITQSNPSGGAANAAELVVRGAGNTVALDQVGEGNEITLNTGVANAFMSTTSIDAAQTGDRNRLSMTVTGTTTSQFTYRQSGADNTIASTAFVAEQTTLSATQTGALNSAATFQTGSGNTMTLIQNGAGNMADLRQSGDAHTLSLMQDGVGNEATLRQAGADNLLQIEQTGDGNQVNFAQDGAGLRVLDAAGQPTVIRQTGGAALTVTQTGTQPITITQLGLGGLPGGGQP